MRACQLLTLWGSLLPLLPTTGAAPSAIDSRESVDTAQRAAQNTFTLSQVKNEQYERLDGVELMVRAFTKFNVPLSPELRYAAKVSPSKKPVPKKQGTVVGTVKAVSPFNHDFEYLVPVLIGTPPQLLYMDLDTGWVVSSETPVNSLNGQDVYHPEHSSTAKLAKGSHWKIKYGDGSNATGNVWTDVVKLGDISFPEQSIETATWISRAFTKDPFSSGLLGLGQSIGNMIQPNKSLTFMDNVRDSLEKPLFTANLKHGSPGNYNFGFIDKTEYTGSIHYAPIEDNSIYWQFTVESFDIGPKPTAKNMTKLPFTTIVDTGTTLMLVPSPVFVEFYGLVQGAVFDLNRAAWVYPCANTLPDFTFSFGEYLGTVPGYYLNAGPLANDPLFCYGGMQSSEGIPFSVFGDVLLKAQFVVFDSGNRKLGFANKKLVSPPEDTAKDDNKDKRL
ncbi:pepsin [Thozetella sp. PMI_491]|nr:pepsin [Thozetella sp. PMI_491]